jgi:hypothetical protein
LEEAEMRKTLAVMACAALIVGCRAGGRDEDRPTQAQQPVTSLGTAQNQALVSVSGCLETGVSGAGEYVLRNVRFEPAGGADPNRNTTTPGPRGITEGSWVRLSGSDELSAHAGKRVTITGAIVDSGQNTVGTAGTSGNTLPSGDRSEAASTDHHSTKVKKEAGRIARESMANGTAAEVKVSSIQASGESCQENAGRK